jgi:hypothetical protein
MCISSSVQMAFDADVFQHPMKQVVLRQESLCSTDVSSSDDDSAYHHDDLQTNEEENDDEYVAETRRTSYPRVHFDVDDNDAIIEYHYIYPRNECADCYATHDEENENAAQLRKECRRIKKQNSYLIHRLNDVYENGVYTNDKNVFNEWVASDLRGFESNLLSESQLQINAYIEFTIIYYRHLQDRCYYGEIDEDDINDMLRSFIINKSRRSTEIAIRFAVADEIEAQKHYNIVKKSKKTNKFGKW